MLTLEAFGASAISLMEPKIVSMLNSIFGWQYHVEFLIKEKREESWVNNGNMDLFFCVCVITSWEQKNGASGLILLFINF